MKQIRRINIFIFLIFIQSYLFGQDFGLQFYGQDMQLDERTGLDLNTSDDFKLKNGFKFEFELAFDQNRRNYFGYILRIIADDRLNLDLIYDNSSNMLNIVDGYSVEMISIPALISQFSDWNKVSVEYLKADNRIEITIFNTTYALNAQSFVDSEDWEFYFGLNRSKNFKTTDLPCMRIRNIQLFENEKLRNSWPLNNHTGTIVKDIVGKNDAIVENPLWLYSLHENWELEKKLHFASDVQFVQKNNSDSLYFLTRDSLFLLGLNDVTFLRSDKLAQPINLERGTQLFYNTNRNTVDYYSVSQQITSGVDPESFECLNMIPYTPYYSAFWHHNKYFNAEDNTLFIVNGYGQLTYKNGLFRIDLNTGTWSPIAVDNDELSPRYLAALGAGSGGDTLYVFGGYGSYSGNQKINPGYAHDLIRIIPEENKVEKIYTLEDPPFENFCFSNSMIIDEATRSFYALAFSKYEYNSKLKLVQGSLDEPKIVEDCKSIPFTFLDIVSYVDLVYLPAQQKLFAITVLHEENGSSDVSMYSIFFPPNVNVDKEETLNHVEVDKSSGFISIIIFIVLTTIVTLMLTFRKVANNIQKNSEDKVKSNFENEQSQKPILVKEKEEEFNEPVVTIVPDKEYSIKLFGGFKIKDKENNNITRKFTPLLKELFLLIFLNSNDAKSTGISPAKLKEILWYDKTDKDASNNRAVNIARLKSLLKKLGDITISKTTGYWKIEYGNDTIDIDYNDYVRITKLKAPDKEDIIVLMQVTRNGDFLNNLSFDWLESFKSEVSNRVIDTFVGFLRANAHQCDPSFLIDITDTIFLYDSVDEDALLFQCRSLSKLGKHSSARKTYDRFAKEYKILYGEDYSQNFNELIV